MSILNGEYVKIGYTSQPVDKRKGALQTGNPYEIDVMFSVEGTLKEEKEIHKSLNCAFERVKVFNNPVNEWYPGENSMIRAFINNIKTQGLEYAVKALDNVVKWKKRVKKEEIFTIRRLEKALRSRGLSQKQAKTIISQKKEELMFNACSKKMEGIADEMVRYQSQVGQSRNLDI